MKRLMAMGVVLMACGGNQASSTETEASEVALHARAPEFDAQDQNDTRVVLRSHRGQAVVLYFYPRDATPGCTTEACAFRDAWSRIQQAGATVFGVSTDDVDAHRAFAEEHQLPFSLLADTDGRIAARYGVPVRMGFARRMTFLIDREGIVRRIFEDVDPAVHVDEVLAAIEALPE